MFKKLQIIYFLLLVTNSNIVKSVTLQYCDTSAHSSAASCVCTLALKSGSIPGVNIDCSYQRLLSEQLSPVPEDAVILNLSWNSLKSVPTISQTNQLEVLNLMHNNISAINAYQFENYNLTKLYLNWNSIQSVDALAFKGLNGLAVLDLSHNNIQTLPPQVFAPLSSLHAIGLAWNRVIKVDKDLDFYQNYGVGAKLTHLSLEACGLTGILLPSNVQLTMLDLSDNQLSKIPSLPKQIEKLDLSGNLFNEIPVAAFAEIQNLTELMLEDLTQLESVRANSLMNLKSVKNLSFQNCRRLSYFDANAFGSNDTLPTLIKLNFRGTALRTLNGNGSLHEVVSDLQILDIFGLPLQCDCHLIWLKELNGIEINGLCMGPSRLRGRRIADIPVAEFECHTWPDWVYELMLVALIIFIAVCIILAVLLFRRYRGVTMRHKVGAGSPYAPVTIQPNNQENNYY